MLLKGIPRETDIARMRQIWSGALEILNGDDKDLKQLVPRDSDDEQNFGKAHIRSLMSMEVSGQGSSTFVAVASKFMSVITHRALLEVMSVDSAVGGLYSFIGRTQLF